MRKALIFCIALLACNLLNAQTFKIVKIQGKKAIVEIDDPDLVEVNKSYNTNVGPAPTDKNKSGYKRDYGIASAFSFSSLKSDVSGATTTTNLSLTGMFLWNLRRYEVGPTLGYSSTKSGTLETTTLSFGGAGFYNFSDHKPTTAKLFSIYGNIAMGSLSGTASGSTTELQVGPNYRWFILSGDHCFSASALFDMIKTTSGATSVTVSGFKVEAGIATYF